MKPIIIKVDIEESHLRGLRSLLTGRKRCRTKAPAKEMRAHLRRIIERELRQLRHNHGAQITMFRE